MGALPAVPAPSTYASGPVLAPQLRGDVADAVAFLTRPPLFTGSQSMSAQVIPNATVEPVMLDTETWDSWAGHEIATGGFRYYGMAPGWYLCESSIPLSYSPSSGAAGAVMAGIGGSQNGGPFTPFFGQVAANVNGTRAQAVAVKLMQMVNTGTFGGSGNDYIEAVAFQTTGSAQQLYNGMSQYPALTAQWVCALSGTQPLPVPANPAWPVPPAYVTSAGLNANVRDAIRFLIYPPVCEYSYQGTGQSLASQSAVPAVGTAIGLDTATVDNYGAYNVAAKTWTAPVGGVYYAYGQLAGISSGSTSQSAGAGLTVTSPNYNSGATVTLWGGTQIAYAGASNVQGAVVRRRLRLAAGDTVQLAGFQRDSASASMQVEGPTNWSSRLIMAWRSA